jgi:EAL domain-containing protein (putative c-di-GMP-specific phosphodiesterase class I)/CheY-like chemotaxis protein
MTSKRVSRILIVDDSEPHLRLLRTILSRVEGVVTITTTDGRQASELFELHQPDLVMLDLHLGDVDGFDVLRSLRRLIASEEYLPIIVVTAGDDATERRRVLEAGAHDILTKPLDFTEIVLRIRHLLEARTHHLDLEAQRSSLAAQLREHSRREDAEAERKRHATKRIRHVLDRRAITIVFQPIVELREGTVLGFEALSRFEDEPKRGPDGWFAEAREVGLGRDLELAAVELALSQIPNMPEEVFLSINASPELLADRVLERLLAGGLGERVVVELTEHVRVEDYEDLNGAVEALRALGARLAVDDVGAGFASLQHILRLGPDMIKLDVSLTRDIDADLIRRALAASLVTFASEVGAQMIAEGIETRRERQALIDLGVTIGQGFYLARPGPLPVPPRLLPTTVPSCITALSPARALPGH